MPTVTESLTQFLWYAMLAMNLALYFPLKDTPKFIDSFRANLKIQVSAFLAITTYTYLVNILGWRGLPDFFPLGSMVVLTFALWSLKIVDIYEIVQLKRQNMLTELQAMSEIETIKVIYGTLVSQMIIIVGQMAYVIALLYNEIERLKDELAKMVIKQQGLTERQKRILELMAKNPRPSIIAMALDLHCSESTIDKEIKKLVNIGLLPKKG